MGILRDPFFCLNTKKDLHSIDYDIGPGTTVDLGYGKEGNPDWKKFGHGTLDSEPVKPTVAKPRPSSKK